MQIYLLAANLFTLAALLLGLGSFSGGTRPGRLLPLFLLVISRSLALIISLAIPATHQMARAGIGALEIFSTFCVVWALTGPTSHLPAPWPKLAWLGTAVALLFSILPLMPIWPIPPEIFSLTIAIFSTSLILTSLGQVRWPHLATPLILALANFLSLLHFTNVSWLINLLAYAFFINAIHWERIQAHYRTYRDQQKMAEALVQEAANLSRERQRWLEVSELISNVPNLSQSMEHIAQSMAHITHADQSAIVMLDGRVKGQARLVTLYSPERPVHLARQGDVAFPVANCPPLQAAIESQRQILLPQPKTGRQNLNGLNKLYALWHEERLGPTLIQPLAVQGQPIGVLVLGNPVTKRPIRENDVRLCQALASQIATLVEHRRRYLELETQARAMAVTEQKQTKEAVATTGPEQIKTAVTVTEPERTNGTVVASKPEQTNRFEAYQAILETIGDGIVVSDTRGQVRLVNRAAERILGKPRRELLGQPIGTIYGEIDTQEPIEDLMVAFSRRNQAVPTFVETNDQVIQGRLVPWRNDEYQWLGIIAVFRDVTREVRADRVRNDFMAALSRELRAPLTTVKGYSELITNGAMGDYSPEQMHVQQIIHSSSERMVEILDNAIRITTQKKHQVLPRFEETDVAKVIGEALREIASLAEVHELSLSREIKTELPLMTIDGRHLRRILDNLLSNACRFTPPGGQVTLRAWVQSEREGNTTRPYLLLAVADTGIGISRIEIKRIFDPFYRGHNQNPDEQGGMGMGLAVVKELVELYNGRVWVESVVGEGSVFQVALPITQEY